MTHDPKNRIWRHGCDPCVSVGSAVRGGRVPHPCV